MTVGEFLKQTKLNLLDARLLVEEVCNLSSTELITKPQTLLTDSQIEELNECTNQRLSGLPVAYILGHKDFYHSTFFTPEGVLIPRPDTETLVEDAISTIKNCKSEKVLKILDICAGTGCIGISIADEVSSQFNEVFLQLSDISPVAYDCFSVNADNILWGRNIKVERTIGDLFSPVETSDFDIVVTNPPYINTAVIETLSPEVRNEPFLALDGGTDGLDVIKKILEKAPEYLKKGGWLFMEIGYDQGERVTVLFEQAGFKDICLLKDLGNNNRVVKGRI